MRCHLGGNPEFQSEMSQLTGSMVQANPEPDERKKRFPVCTNFERGGSIQSLTDYTYYHINVCGLLEILDWHMQLTEGIILPNPETEL